MALKASLETELNRYNLGSPWKKLRIDRSLESPERMGRDKEENRM